jgi:hypothetical protein
MFNAIICANSLLSNVSNDKFCEIESIASSTVSNSSSAGVPVILTPH